MAYVDMDTLERIRAHKKELEQNPAVMEYLTVCALFDNEVAQVKDDLLNLYRQTGFKAVESDHFKVHVRRTESFDMDRIGLDIISQLMNTNPDAVNISVAGFRKAQKDNEYLAGFDLARLTKIAKLTAVLEAKE